MNGLDIKEKSKELDFTEDLAWKLGVSKNTKALLI